MLLWLPLMTKIGSHSCQLGDRQTQSVFFFFIAALNSFAAKLPCLVAVTCILVVQLPRGDGNELSVTPLWVCCFSFVTEN